MIEEKSITGTEAGRVDYSDEVTVSTISIPRISQQARVFTGKMDVGPGSEHVLTKTAPEGKSWIVTNFQLSAPANVLIGLQFAKYIDGERTLAAYKKGYQSIKMKFRAGIATDDVESTLMNHGTETYELHYSHALIEVPAELVEAIVG